MSWGFKHKSGNKSDNWCLGCPIGVDHIHEDLKEFKEIDEHLTDAKGVVKNMVNEDKQALKKAADLGTHIDQGNDAGMYAETVDTDLTHRDKVVPTWDDKDPNGVSKGHQDQRDAGETMLTQEVMDRKEMPKIDFRDPKQPSSNAAGDLYDGANRPGAPKEGEVLGLQPSYSAAELYVAITPRNAAWGFERESLFDQFIGNVGEILASCKAHGASRAAAREAAIKVHSSLFAKHEWMSPILERFLDRAYGTSAKVQSSLSTLEGCVSDFVVTAHKNGWAKTKTLQASVNEFSSWIENYPETQTLIENKIDAAYGVSPEVIAPFIAKQAANEFAVRLTKSFTKFPLPYAEFRRWCSAQQVTVPTLYALERIAVELNYVTMPETLVVFSETKTYMTPAQPGVAPKVVTKEEDPSNPAKVKKVTLDTGEEATEVKPAI
jgi:hypothetical protein